MLRIGLIGTGFMGSMHAACYEVLAESGVEIAAVADLDEEKAKKAVKKFDARIFKTGEELIEKADVDAIDICLPTYLHSIHAIKAMEKGRAVFIEKPVCINSKQAKELLDARKKTGANVMVGQCLRLFPEYVWLKETKESGKYGELRSAILRRVSPSPTWTWQNWMHNPELSGTVATDLHIHDADIIRYILGEPDRLVSEASRDDDGVIQQIFTIYGYKGPDRLVMAEAAWDFPPAFPFSMSYIVKFDDATAVYNSALDPSLVLYTADGGRTVPELGRNTASASGVEGNISSLAGYYDELKYFTEKVMAGEEILMATLEEGVKSLELVLEEIKLVGGVKI